jgi:indolepyruvate decarboxylase
MELGNARRLGLNPIVLVFNNASWGMLKVLQPGMHYNDLGVWNCAELATALGGVGRRVETREELALALGAAAEDTSTWHLIEIIIPRGEYSRTLTRFVAAAGQRSVAGRGGERGEHPIGSDPWI